MPMICHGVDMTIECQRMSEDLDNGNFGSDHEKSCEIL